MADDEVAAGMLSVSFGWLGTRMRGAALIDKARDQTAIKRFSAEVGNMYWLL